MGGCDLNEELAEKVVRFLLKIPDGVWEELFDQLPEFQKMPKEFENWPFGKQVVVLMVGALNDYRTDSEKYWEEFYGSFGTPPKEPENLENLKGMLKSVQRICKNQKSRKCNRMKEFLDSELAKELWKQHEEYFREKENIKSIWKRLENFRPHSKNKTVLLAIKDLTILVMKRTKDTSILNSIELPVLVDSRIQRLTKNLAGCDNDLKPKDVGSFWKLVFEGSENGSTKIRGLKNEKPWLTMIHLDTLLWFIGGDCSKLFSLLMREELKMFDG